MGRPSRRLLRGLLRVAVLGVAAGCLLAALLIILPAPDELLRFVGVAATEFSLIITAAGVLGLGLAALARRVGLRSTARVAAAVHRDLAGVAAARFRPADRGGPGSLGVPRRLSAAAGLRGPDGVWFDSTARLLAARPR